MFDYKVINTCQFGLLDSHNEVSDCGEPATHEVWWDDGLATMPVCLEHFKFIKHKEEE